MSSQFVRSSPKSESALTALSLLGILCFPLCPSSTHVLGLSKYIHTDRQTIITERPSSRLPCVIMASLLQNHPNSSRLPKLFLIPLEAAYRPALHCVNCWLWETMGDGVMKIFSAICLSPGNIHTPAWESLFIKSFVWRRELKLKSLSLGEKNYVQFLGNTFRNIYKINM